MKWQQKPVSGASLSLGHPLAQGLVGFWLLTEGDGDEVYDLSGNANIGKLTNMAFPGTTISGWTPGMDGSSLAFDYIDDYVDCGNGPSLQIGGAGKSFSLSTWTKRAGTSWNYVIGQGVGGQNTGLHFGYQATHEFLFAFYADDLHTADLYPDMNEWHHWVGTYDGNTNARKIYRDGVEVASDIAADDFLGSGTLYIGCRFDRIRYYHGLISEVRIYDRELAAIEVQQLYSDPYVMFVAPLLPSLAVLGTYSGRGIGRGIARGVYG